MKHQAAYSLLFLAGKSEPTKAEVEKFMKACGVSVDKEALGIFFQAMEGKSVTEAVKAGSSKLVSMPSGGGGGARAATSGPVAEEAPKEEEKKEEEEDVDMGGLFGDDEDDY